jgi:hypothetical protein
MEVSEEKKRSSDWPVSGTNTLTSGVQGGCGHPLDRWVTVTVHLIIVSSYTGTKPV